MKMTDVLTCEIDLEVSLKQNQLIVNSGAG
jgi:hypothetical protein